MDEFKILNYQLKTIEISKIRPIELTDKIKKILKHPIMKGLNPFDLIIIDKKENEKNLYLNNSILEFIKNSKNECFKCGKCSEYKNVDTDTFLCWQHCL